MGQVLIRNVPDEIIETYRAKAKLHGRSLEEELRKLLELNRPYSQDERLAVALAIQSRTKPAPVGVENVADLIRAERDNR
ncbi:MAG: FitA-like ribbon-helix-helix domain-containing protein [Beijerinckiaceae bacterium]